MIRSRGETFRRDDEHLRRDAPPIQSTTRHSKVVPKTSAADVKTFTAPRSTSAPPAANSPAAVASRSEDVTVAVDFNPQFPRAPNRVASAPLRLL